MADDDAGKQAAAAVAAALEKTEKAAHDLAQSVEGALHGETAKKVAEQVGVGVYLIWICPLACCWWAWAKWVCVDMWLLW